MSSASLQAWDRILPEITKREQAVMGVLLKAAEAPGYPGSHLRGPCGRTNRQIAAALGIDRDSVSPRTARLRQKGLVVEAGISGSETLYEAALNPNFVKAPGRRKPKAYYDALRDAHSVLCAKIESGDNNTTDGLAEAAKVIEGMIP